MFLEQIAFINADFRQS